MAQSFKGQSGLPLGLQNNNVGNIRPVGNGMWEGQVGVNKGFSVFDDVAWGIRAFATNMYSSINKHGTDTLRKYITRYAPESENDTSRYVSYVSNATGINPDAPIPTDVDNVRKILRAQMEIELGKRYADMVTDEDINEGLSRLSSPVASFFSAVGVFYSQNKKKVNYAIVGLILISLTAYAYFLKKKKII